MCYTILIVSLICCTCLPAPARSDGRNCERGQLSAVIAQAGTTAAPDRKAPAHQKKDSESAETQEQEKQQQKDKKPAPKDFVPSENIDADKAVDFPADI